MKNLYIIRGLPGSGKSTLAKKLAGRRYREADMFFIDKFGNYNFDSSKIQQAHAWCLANIEVLLIRSDNDVAVSNTFSCKWEYEKYVELAQKYGFQPIIIECQNDFDNTHDVPVEVINKMRLRFER